MKTLFIKQIGLQEYNQTYTGMASFTDKRNATTADEVWLLEHPPVYTLGMAGKPEHIIDSGAIPVIKTDRGGQVTYHGPGQLIAYLLLDLRRKSIGIKRYVYLLEQIVIDMLSGFDLDCHRRAGAPGVYINDRKIAALGVRVRRGCCYHGLALNIDMDLSPFSGIHPCGYPDLEVTQVSDFDIDMTVARAAEFLIPKILKYFTYDNYEILTIQNGVTAATNHAAA